MTSCCANHVIKQFHYLFTVNQKTLLLFILIIPTLSLITPLNKTTTLLHEFDGDATFMLCSACTTQD